VVKGLYHMFLTNLAIAPRRGQPVLTSFAWLKWFPAFSQEFPVVVFIQPVALSIRNMYLGR